MWTDPLVQRAAQAASAARSAVEAFGFRLGDKGTHTSRTMMLDELNRLLVACPPDAEGEHYAQAILEDNCLGKRTTSTRRLTLQRLRELYGLKPAIPLFRILRWLWALDESGRPLLALQAALARDPLLRATADVLINMEPTEELARQQLTDAIAEGTAGRLSEATLDKVVRNTASSWTQSGHLRGRGRKVRQRVSATPAAATFAILLGHTWGERGERLLTTPWAKGLDASPDELLQLAIEAKRMSLLDMSQSGGVTEFSFRRVLLPEERDLVHGTY